MHRLTRLKRQSDARSKVEDNNDTAASSSSSSSIGCPSLIWPTPSQLVARCDNHEFYLDAVSAHLSSLTVVVADIDIVASVRRILVDIGSTIISSVQQYFDLCHTVSALNMVDQASAYARKSDVEEAIMRIEKGELTRQQVKHKREGGTRGMMTTIELHMSNCFIVHISLSFLVF